MGFVHDSPREQEPLQFVQDSPPFVEFEEYPDSFLDSILNFDGWVDDHPNSLLLEAMDSEDKPNLEVKKEDEVCGFERLEDLGSLIQEGMGMVSLTSNTEVIDGLGSGEVKVADEIGMRDDEDKISDKDGMGNDEVKVGDENGMRNDEVQIGDVKGADENRMKNDVEKSDESSQDSEEESSEESEEESSSSSSSSSDEDDVKKVKGVVEMEEGEIREEMVSWSEDEDGAAVKGPVRSKNEFQDLPPVPPVTVTIEPHHQILPVGVVLSIIGAQVIVEGVENHNPLSEGSILWITESRSPLGVVDEIFGPIKNPYYIVRYNSESEVPSGIQQGSLISFVPEFADYVLNNKDLYKKGYDASGENDEELSEEVEFSDDEKEAEYRRMIKMSKRGSNEQKNGHMKKDKKSRNWGGNWKNESGSSDGPASGPGMNMAVSQGPPAPNFTGPPPPGAWPNGFNMGIPPFMPQNFIQQPFQNLGLPNLSPFPPQLNNGRQMFPTNFVQNVAQNFNGNPAFAPWPVCMPQNNFNQQQVGPPMGFSGFSGPSVNMNVPPQGGLMPNGPQMDHNGASRPPFVAGNGEPSQNGNRGKGFPNRGGRRPFQRGGGRFRGGSQSR